MTSTGLCLFLPIKITAVHCWSIGDEVQTELRYVVAWVSDLLTAVRVYAADYPCSAAEKKGNDVIVNVM